MSDNATVCIDDFVIFELPRAKIVYRHVYSWVSGGERWNNESAKWQSLDKVTDTASLRSSQACGQIETQLKIRTETIAMFDQCVFVLVPDDWRTSWRCRRRSSARASARRC